MQEKRIEQIWYTWSSTGVFGASAGYRVRAASPVLSNLAGLPYLNIAPYLYYELPKGVPGSIDPHQAPVCLAFQRTQNGLVLMHKVYVGRDEIGRGGNFFVHLLSGLPDNFLARDAIRLWNADFWQRQNEPLSTHPVRLQPVPLHRLQELSQAARQNFDFTRVEDELCELIKHFLTVASYLQPLLIEGDAQSIAMLIWGVTHAIPAQLLPTPFTFSTYEHNPKRTNDLTVVGTITADTLSASEPIRPFVTPVLSPEAFLETDIADFAKYAVKCLLDPQNERSGRSPWLDSLVLQAESGEANVRNVKDFIELFKNQLLKDQLDVVEINPVQLNTVDQLDIPAIDDTSEEAVKPLSEPILHPSFGNDVSTIDVKNVKNKYNKQNIIFAAIGVIFLLFASNLLTYCTATNQNKTLSIQSTALAQANRSTLAQVNAHGYTQATTIAELYATATAVTLINTELQNSYKIVSKPNNPKFAVGTLFSLTLVLNNNGQSTWSDRGGYRLACVTSDNNPLPDPDCKYEPSVSFAGNRVAPGTNYPFTLKFKLNVGITGLRTIILQLQQHGQRFGNDLVLQFTLR